MAGRFPGLYLRTALRVVAVTLFAGLLGLAIATLLVSRAPIPEEITSSPASPERQLTTASEVLNTGGGFVTSAGDGEAYIDIRFKKPEAFNQLSHFYRLDVPMPQRIVLASLQTSNDGINWTKVGEAQPDGPYGVFYFTLTQTAASKFWKVTVIKSGDAPDVAFGQLSFIDRTNAVQDIPVDAAWFALVPALILLLLAFQVPLTPGRLFLVTAVPVALFVLTYSLGYVGYSIVLVPDSRSYLNWLLEGSFSPGRSVGYPIVLIAVQKLFGLDYLAWVQLSAALACYFAGAYLLAVRFGNRWVAILFAVAVLFQGTTSQYATDVLTEALFTAGLGLFAAALGALAWRPDRLAVAAAAIGLALAVLTKAVGIVLVVPALLLIRFLPGGKRLSVAAPIVVAGLATYAMMAAHNFSRTGAFTPESFAGISLAGHVGWMLDDTSMPPSELSGRLISAAAPVVAQRPADLANIHSLATLDRYVDVTVQDYNPIIWGKLVPTAKSALGSQEEINSFLLRLAISSIRAHPWTYLRHAAAHYYGLWRYMSLSMTLVTATEYARGQPAYALRTLGQAFVKKATSTLLTPYRSDAVLRGEAVSQSKLPLQFAGLWNFCLITEVGPMLLGALSLVLSILFLLPGRLPQIYRTEIMIALSLNAYFGAHVLLQVALPRYAGTGVIVVIFLALSFAVTTACVLKRLLATGLGAVSDYRGRSA